MNQKIAKLSTHLWNTYHQGTKFVFESKETLGIYFKKQVFIKSYNWLWDYRLSNISKKLLFWLRWPFMHKTIFCESHIRCMTKKKNPTRIYFRKFRLGYSIGVVVSFINLHLFDNFLFRMNFFSSERWRQSANVCVCLRGPFSNNVCLLIHVNVIFLSTFLLKAH